MKLTLKRPLGKTGIQVPRIIYGTSYLGNLYRALSYEEKLSLIRTWFKCTEVPVVIDTAGKYGAGLALEVIGKGLKDLGIPEEDVVISNKLGWFRIPLSAGEPAFEPGAWKDIHNDCIQTFGREGILHCFEQGNELLGGTYRSGIVSVHDPDEYLLGAENPDDRKKRFMEIIDSYKALFELKEKGKVRAVGIGSKDWKIIRELYDHVPFDWVMFANSFTIYNHPRDLIDFLDRLNALGVGVINSAVFHGGFLTGGSMFDYKQVNPDSEEGIALYEWRNKYNRVCSSYDVEPGDSCLHFGLSHPAVVSLALNTSKPEKMVRNVEKLQQEIPEKFWQTLREEGLIDPDFPYL